MQAQDMQTQMLSPMRALILSKQMIQVSLAALTKQGRLI